MIDELPLIITGSSKREPNPCVSLYGPYNGPIIQKCRNCALLFHSGSRYLKCKLRRHTRGAGTDHKAGWNACAKFQSKAK